MDSSTVSRCHYDKNSLSPLNCLMRCDAIRYNRYCIRTLHGVYPLGAVS
jgi:hypothetical protein